MTDQDRIKQFLAVRQADAQHNQARRDRMVSDRYPNGKAKASVDLDYGYWSGFFAGQADAYRIVTLFVDDA